VKLPERDSQKVSFNGSFRTFNIAAVYFVISFYLMEILLLVSEWLPGLNRLAAPVKWAQIFVIDWIKANPCRLT
jgi:hypothetical protein